MKRTALTLVVAAVLSFGASSSSANGWLDGSYCSYWSWNSYVYVYPGGLYRCAYTAYYNGLYWTWGYFWIPA